MSRLIDRLKRVSGVAPQPMGFRVAREEAEKPGIFAIASIASNKLSKMDEKLTGADAVVSHVADSDSGIKLAKEISQSLSGIPCGLWLDDVDGKNIKKAANASGDFIIFPANASLAVLKEGKPGKILEVPAYMEASLLRAVNELPVDAVLITAEGVKDSTLTCKNLLFFHLCAGLLEKSLLASVPLSISADELQTLWEAGISGVVLAIEDEPSLERFAALRGEIDRATFPPRRRRRKVEVVLPSAGGLTEEAEEEEEEEEE